MVEVRLSVGAQTDLDSIASYLISQGSPESALKIVRSLRKRVESLAEFPLRGSVPQELAEMGHVEFRQLAHPPYRIFYRASAELVDVVLIADGRRDMRSLLTQRLLSR